MVSFRLVAAAAALVFGVLPALAQNATVSGSIVDTSGGAIPQAKVRVRNTATNVAVETTTNTQGLFFLPPLAPGSYQLIASATGFSESEVNDLVLEVGQQRNISLKLEPGQLKQTISVEAVAPCSMSSPRTAARGGECVSEIHSTQCAQSHAAPHARSGRNRWPERGHQHGLAIHYE